MKKSKIYIAILIVMLVTCRFSFGQSTTLTLTGALEAAAHNNPELKAAFNRYLAALEKIPQAGALPDPQASFGFFVSPMANMNGEQLGNIQLIQMFPWFGTLKAGKSEATEQAKAKLEGFNSVKADLFFRIKKNWYQLMKTDREIKLVQQHIDLLKSLEALVEIKYQAPGTGMPAMNQAQLPDILRIKMEIPEKQNQLASLTDRRKTEEVTFNALLNRDTNAPVQIDDSLRMEVLPAAKTAIADSILQNNPVLAMIEKQNDSYREMEYKNRKMGLPKLGIGFTYSVNEERAGNTFSKNGNDMLMPMVSVTIPINRKKYNAMQKEARLLQEAGKEQLTDTQNQLKVQYRNFIQKLDDAKRRADLYSEQELLARKTTDLLITGFSNGQNTYDDVLQMQNKVLDYGFKHTEAITDYNTAVATAEKLMNAIKIQSYEDD